MNKNLKVNELQGRAEELLCSGLVRLKTTKKWMLNTNKDCIILKKHLYQDLSV